MRKGYPWEKKKFTELDSTWSRKSSADLLPRVGIGQFMLITTLGIGWGWMWGVTGVSEVDSSDLGFFLQSLFGISIGKPFAA
jgi:hypothetical protein